MLYLRFALLSSLLLALGCQPASTPSSTPTPAITDVPDWTHEAIWYQIFVERFRNGDPSNDPTLADIEGSWPHLNPEGWAPTPWTHDWYAQEDWAQATGEDFYLTVQSRRYGGDIQGVIDQLDYLQDLGITAIFLNPINDAPSLHKYDARNYRHVDRNFGPDPEGDATIMAQEDPADPSTWQWTAADRLFLQLVEEVHARGMRIIMDYSWNHTGITFWAWQDVLENQAASPYADWYQIRQFDDPSTPENEFDYEGWAGVRELPNLTKVGVPEGYHGGPAEGDLHPEVKAHAFAVTQRWLDPNGDGDPSDGVDGFRLDVAEMVPFGFWRDYRTFVRDINPDAYLVGEIWWESWPERMMDPKPYLADIFDAVMHYRWYMPTRSFMTGGLPTMTATEYVAHLDSVEAEIPQDNLLAMMNLTASHDSPRFATSIANKNRYKYRATPRDEANYIYRKPDDAVWDEQKRVLVQQFTYYGAPHIWNGDEVGMWGADDPDNRKPLLWDDLTYDPERALVNQDLGETISIAPSQTHLAFYKQLIALRKAYMDLFVYGDLTYLHMDDATGTLAYRRSHEGEEALVLFNTLNTDHTLNLPAEAPTYRSVLGVNEAYTPVGGQLAVDLPAGQSLILLAQ